MVYKPPIRLYTTEALTMNAPLTLPPAQSHYLCNVMRKKQGSLIALFNGKDGEWEAQIDTADKKHCELTLTKQLRDQHREKPLALAYAPVKNVAQHFIIQKATEMGIINLYPVFTEHTIINKINHDKLAANAIEAAEQCERLTVPTIHLAQKLAAFLTSLPENHILLFCDESGNGTPAPDITLPQNRPLTVLIGPEGGFSQQEQHILAQHNQTVAISMGPRILRADTAAIAALTIAQLLAGDWNQHPRSSYA